MGNLKKISAILILFTIVLAFSVANTVHATGVIATIPLVTYPEGVAYDSGKSEIFVTNNDNNIVSVISDKTNTVVTNVTVGDLSGEGPISYGEAYDSNKGEIFVANGNNMVSVISDKTNTVVANVTVGDRPDEIAYDSGKSEIFVTNNAADTVSVISDSNDSVIATVNVGNEPVGCAVEPVGIAYDSVNGEVFVANSNLDVYLLGGNVPSTISVISDSTNTVIATITVGWGAWGVAYDSGKGEIFVSNFNSCSDTVSVILDSSILAVPAVSSHSMVNQGATSNLTASATITGIPPLIYQWFSEAPNASSYSLISGATSSSYVFATSNSTATGNWSFIFQVTDSTGATVNSTVTTLTVNPSTSTASPFPNPNVTEFNIQALILVAAIMVAVTICAVASARKKLTRTNSDSKQTKK